MEMNRCAFESLGSRLSNARRIKSNGPLLADIFPVKVAGISEISTPWGHFQRKCTFSRRNQVFARKAQPDKIWRYFDVHWKAHGLSIATHINSSPYLVWLSFPGKNLIPTEKRAFPLKTASRRRDFWYPGHFDRENISEQWSVGLDSVCVGKPRPWAFLRTSNHCRILSG